VRTMLDENLIMERIRKMTPEERRRIMQKALEDSHIKCMDGPGAVIFEGFSAEKETILWESSVEICLSNVCRITEQYDSTIVKQKASFAFSSTPRSEFVFELYTPGTSAA